MESVERMRIADGLRRIAALEEQPARDLVRLVTEYDRVIADLRAAVINATDADERDALDMSVSLFILWRMEAEIQCRRQIEAEAMAPN